MEADFIEFATTNLAKPLEDYDEQDHVIDEVFYIFISFPKHLGYFYERK